MSSTDRVAVARTIIDAIHSESTEHRSQMFETHFTTDAMVYLQFTWVSIDEFLESQNENRSVFTTDRFELCEVVSADDTVGAYGVGEHRQVSSYFGCDPSDETYETAIAFFFEFSGAAIERLRIVENREPLYRHLGFLSKDLVDAQIRQQYREVINRVLRHNLRNDLTVVLGTAELLRESDVDHESLSERIEATARDTLDTVEKAFELEKRVMGREMSPESIDLRSLLEMTLERFDALDDVTFAIDTPEDDTVSLTTDRILLATVVEELTRNAIKHVDAPTTRIAFEVTDPPTDEFAAEIVVSDNGNGIPSDEIAPIQQGTETALLHGSGIGLWVVRWCIERMHGDLTFETDERDGTRVRMLLADLN